MIVCHAVLPKKLHEGYQEREHEAEERAELGVQEDDNY
jgi:hypothetical protein